MHFGLDLQFYFLFLVSLVYFFPPRLGISNFMWCLILDDNEEKVTTTPLIEFITSRKNEWMKFKEEKKEERRRRDIERRKLKEETKKNKREAKESAKVRINVYIYFILVIGNLHHSKSSKRILIQLNHWIVSAPNLTHI